MWKRNFVYHLRITENYTRLRFIYTHIIYHWKAEILQFLRYVYYFEQRNMLIYCIVYNLSWFIVLYCVSFKLVYCIVYHLSWTIIELYSCVGYEINMSLKTLTVKAPLILIYLQLRFFFSYIHSCSLMLRHAPSIYGNLT